jgi:hypothetical protein
MAISSAYPVGTLPFVDVFPTSRWRSALRDGGAFAPLRAGTSDISDEVDVVRGALKLEEASVYVKVHSQLRCVMSVMESPKHESGI